MTGSKRIAANPGRWASRPELLRAACLIGLTLILITESGCRNMWGAVRERERLFALETARTQTQRGQCGPGLSSLDRAQARIDIGLYARESTLARLRCYEKLKLGEMASAHRRLLTDFYTDEPLALPDADGSSIFRVKTISAKGYARPPRWLQIPAPRYTPYAQRSKIVGRVTIAFEIASNGLTKRIRILEMPHPLLATWAIEAISQAKSKGSDFKTLMPGTRFVTTFVFEWRWATPKETEFES